MADVYKRQALDRIKAAYTTAADENVHFLQTVRVDKAVAPAALAETDSALYDTLSQCLDVTATRAVTYTEQIPFDTVTQENENQDQTYLETVQQLSLIHISFFPLPCTWQSPIRNAIWMMCRIPRARRKSTLQ